MTEINYTIIIPHKNNPKLLLRCLDSIPEREDIQVIVVDDNSASYVNISDFCEASSQGEIRQRDYKRNFKKTG